MKKLYISEEQKKHLKKAIAAQDQVGGKVNAGIMGAVTGMVCERNGSNMQTWYRGYDSKHGLRGTYSPYLLWLTDDLEYAQSYGDAVMVFVIDVSKCNGSIYDLSEDTDYYDGPSKEEADALLEQGINSYCFYANQDSSYCMCLWSNEPIISQHPLEMNENIEDSTYEIGFEKGGFEPNAHIVQEDLVYQHGATPHKEMPDFKPNIQPLTMYKQFKLRLDKNGNNLAPGYVFPLYVNTEEGGRSGKDSQGLQIGKWYRSGEGECWLDTKNNRLYTKGKGYGTDGNTIEKLAYRPGWHLTTTPWGNQRGDNKVVGGPKGTGNNYLNTRNSEVWAKVEICVDIDATERARSMSTTPADQCLQNLGDREYYKYRTNSNATDDQSWYIVSMIRIVDVLDDDTVDATNDAYYADIIANNPDKKLNSDPYTYTKDMVNDVPYWKMPRTNGKRYSRSDIENMGYHAVEPTKLNENHEWCDNFEYTPYLKSIARFLQEKGINVNPFPKVVLHKDEQDGLYIKTGYYDPDNKQVHLFIADRHPKDVLRSFVHEMIHHYQNLRGELQGYKGETLDGDEVLQKLESEAYLKGNIYFRKWTEELHPVIPGKKKKLKESIEGDNITTWYRGYNKTLGNQRTHLLWLSSSLKYAASYGNEVIEYKVNEAKCNGSIDDLSSETDYYEGPDYNETQELLKRGINCYFFDAMNDAETLVLFNKSPIVSERVMDNKEVKAKLGLLNESIQDIYNMQEDWDEFGVSSLLSEFFRDKKRGITKKQWNLIPAQQYQNLLTRYMQDPITARIPENVVYDWFEKVVKNAFDIEYITELAGHSQWFPADEVQEEFDAWVGEKYEITDYASGYEALEAEGFYEWCSLPDGSDGWSDYGLVPIFNELANYKPNMSAGDLLILINRVLHIGHCRGDLASAFIEGGSQSCSAISGIIREGFDMGEITNPEDVDLSSFELNDELNPRFWKNGKIDSRVRVALLDIADDFIDSLDVEWAKPIDIIVTGSIANYNWSQEHSDIDLHVVMDFSEVDENVELVKDYFDSKRKNWNDEHQNITIAGFPVELYVQDVNESHASSGVYSLEHNKWLVKPSYDNFDVDYDKDTVKEKVSEYMNEIDDLCDEYDDSVADIDLSEIHEKAEGLFKRIKDERKKGFENGGDEYNVGNLIFKSLRRNGYIGKLINIRTKTYDEMKSLYNENKINQ